MKSVARYEIAVVEYNKKKLVNRGYIGGRVIIYLREPDTRFLPSNVQEIDHYKSGGFMVRASITLDVRTHVMSFARGTMTTAVRYRDEVLQPYVRLFTGIVDSDFILMDDNARHIELIGSMNFCRVRIFAELIGQLDLQTSFV